MVKVVFGWKDNPELGSDQCEAHYRAHHMPLAREVFTGADGFRLLRYNRVRAHRVNDYNTPAARPAEPDMDAFVELYFDSATQLEAAMAHPVLRRMFDDHPHFMATGTPANIRIYEVDEEVVLEAPVAGTQVGGG